MASYSGQEFSESPFSDTIYQAEYRQTQGIDNSSQYPISDPGYNQAYGESNFYGSSSSDRDASRPTLGVHSNFSGTDFSSGFTTVSDEQMSSSSFYLDTQRLFERVDRTLSLHVDGFRDGRQYSPTLRSSQPTEGGKNFVDQWRSDYGSYDSARNFMDDARNVNVIDDREQRESHRTRLSPGRESTAYDKDNRRARDKRQSRSPRRHDKYSSNSTAIVIEYGHSNEVSRYEERFSKSKDDGSSEEASWRKNKYSKSGDDGYSDDKDHDRRSSDVRDHEQKSCQDDSGCGDGQGTFERRVSCDLFKFIYFHLTVK